MAPQDSQICGRNFQRGLTFCNSTFITQITYASPAWNGFLSVADRNRLQSIVTKAKGFGYLPANYDSFDQLCDKKLFFNVRYNPNHVLHQLLPTVKCSGYDLRSRRHNYTLPNNNTTLISNNFINRMLFADMYWLLMRDDLYMDCHDMLSLILSFSHDVFIL